MALTGAQIVLVAEVTREAYATIEGLAPALTSDQETILSADLVTWNLIRNSHVKLTGEVDFDNSRKRAAIYYRVRNMFGLPFLQFFELNAPDVLELVQLDVGQNFV